MSSCITRGCKSSMMCIIWLSPHLYTTKRNHVCYRFLCLFLSALCHFICFCIHLLLMGNPRSLWITQVGLHWFVFTFFIHDINLNQLTASCESKVGNKFELVSELIENKFVVIISKRLDFVRQQWMISSVDNAKLFLILSKFFLDCTRMFKCEFGRRNKLAMTWRCEMLERKISIFVGFIALLTATLLYSLTSIRWKAFFLRRAYLIRRRGKL